MNTQNFEAKRFSTPYLLSMLIGDTEAQTHANTPLSVLFGMRSTLQSGVVCETAAAYLPTPELLAAKELFVRALHEEMTYDPITLNSPRAAKDYLKLLLGGREQEVFVVLLLDAQHRLIATKETNHGTLTQTSVYPREIVKLALHHNAAAVSFAHNHPSGISEPSQSDRLLTDALKNALSLVDVRVLDHFIVGNEEVLSFAEKGWI